MPPVRVRPPLHRDRTPNPSRESRRRDDAGFTVVEALVSLILLAIVGASAITAMVTSSRTSKNTSDRVNASNLAQQDQQAAAAIRYPAYPSPIPSHPVAVGGTTYTVARAVSSACPTTPNYDSNPYMVVTTTVTWPAVAAAAAAAKVVMATELAC